MPTNHREVHLLVCISFHYVESRLVYLREVLAQQPALAGQVDVRVFTNATNQGQLESIRACFPADADNSVFRIVPVCALPHPFFLTWAHKQVLTNDFLNDPAYTHFMYIEDDLLVRPENITYWLAAREALRPYGLIPSFFRVEKDDRDGVWRSTDQVRKVKLHKTPRVRLKNEKRWYINLKNPYQGMYLFDRELASEHVAGPAMHPDYHAWGIREQANQGQSFVQVPKGFKSRNVVPVDADRLAPEPCCRVHHLPNNYANDPTTRYGKIPVAGVVFLPRLSGFIARLT
jgi:hypothetical protein